MSAEQAKEAPVKAVEALTSGEIKYVKIVWEGIETRDNWTDPSDLKGSKAPQIETVGWFLGPTDDGKRVIVASTIDPTDGEDKPFLNAIRIPLALAVSAEILQPVGEPISLR